MFELASRNEVPLRQASVVDLRRAYDFGDLQSFLSMYYEGARVLCKARDFYDLTAAYIRRAAEDNVRHAEISFDPQTHTARGVVTRRSSLNMQMGLGHERFDDDRKAWTSDFRVSESNHRQFYQRWAQLMAAESWAKV